MTDLPPQGGLGQSWFVLELDSSVEVTGEFSVRNHPGVEVKVSNPVKVVLSSVQGTVLNVAVRSQASIQVAINKIDLMLRKKGE